LLFALSSATELPIVAAITEIGLHFDHHADENRDRLSGSSAIVRFSAVTDATLLPV